MSRFKKFYLGLVIVLAAFWTAAAGYVAVCMAAYEAAQPERAVERAAARLRAGENLPGVDFQVPVSRFEDREECSQVFFSRLNGKKLTCEQSGESYDVKNPVFTVSSEEGPVATVALREVSSKPLMFVLSAPEWEVASVTLELGAGTKPLRVAVPDCFTVKINGIKADERELSGDPLDIPAFRYAAEYVKAPQLVEYVIGGLYLPPELEILDNLGRAVEFTVGEDNSVLVDEWRPSEEMDGELRGYVLKNAKNYSNFFSADLPGSAAGTGPIEYMFPEDSYYLKLADTYRLHDMWMYSPHYPPRFVEERVYGYTRYSGDLFSCVVYLDKKMTLISDGSERHDIQHTRYYYVRIGQSWLIADMRAVVDEGGGT